MKFQISLATKYMRGRKLRTFLTTLAIVIGVMVIFGMGILVPTMTEAFNKSLLAASGQTDVMITHKTGETFSASTLNKIKMLDGIAAIGGSLERTINLPPDFYGKNSTVSALSLVGIDPTVAPELHDYRITQGRFLKQGDGNVAVISERLADSLGVKLNDTMKLPTTEGVVKLAIVGLLPSRALVGNEQVFVTLSQAQKLLDASGRINVIEANLTTKDKAQSDAIVNNIKAQLGNTYTLGGLTSGSEFATTMQNSAAIFNMIGLLALAMGAFIIFNTFRTIVAERRHDIGMLRAIGANRATIRGLVLTEGLVQGVVGTAIGIGLGYLLGVGIISGDESIHQTVHEYRNDGCHRPVAVYRFDCPGCRCDARFGLNTRTARQSRHADGSIASVARRNDATHQPRGHRRRRADASHRRRGIAQRHLCARRAGRSAAARRACVDCAGVGQTDSTVIRRLDRAGCCARWHG